MTTRTGAVVLVLLAGLVLAGCTAPDERADTNEPEEDVPGAEFLLGVAGLPDGYHHCAPDEAMIRQGTTENPGPVGEQQLSGFAALFGPGNPPAGGWIEAISELAGDTCSRDEGTRWVTTIFLAAWRTEAEQERARHEVTTVQGGRICDNASIFAAERHIALVTSTAASGSENATRLIADTFSLQNPDFVDPCPPAPDDEGGAAED